MFMLYTWNEADVSYNASDYMITCIHNDGVRMYSAQQGRGNAETAVASGIITARFSRKVGRNAQCLNSLNIKRDVWSLAGYM
jgi:hypothetical protein